MAPLLHPPECSILLLDPKKQHIGSCHVATQGDLIQYFQLIERAAASALVPCHFALGGDPVDLLAKPSPDGESLVYPLSNSGPSWSNSGIAAALSAGNRSNLILCGFWLETRVTFMALHALSSGFDVFVLMDASPSFVAEARGPSSDRLLQAGAVPLTTRQLIAEWAEQSADLALRTNLSRLAAS